MASARFAWGIDVGNRALKAVKLVRDGNQLRVDDFDVIEHETVLSQAGDNREQLIQTALANFVGRHSVKGGAVAVGVSGQQSFARFIKLPPVEEKKIPEIVRFEAIQQIPFPLDDVEWSYQLFRSDQSPDVEVGIFAMRKELVNQHIKFFTDVDLNVQVVQMNPLAVYNAVNYDGRLNDGTTMIVDMGAENTDLIIADADTIWMRSVPIGGNGFTETLTKAFKLPFAKAEEMKRTAATSKYARQIFQAMRPIFADLVAEIQRSVAFYASGHRDSRITRIIALGGAFKLPGLSSYLQKNLQMDVLVLDNVAAAPASDSKLAPTFNENILSLVSAYGLAVQAMDDGKVTSSLLPTHIRREKVWKEKTKWFAAAAALFLVGTGIGYGKYFLEDLSFNSGSAVDARQKIDSTISSSKSLASEWSTIESAGGPEKAKVANVSLLLDLRSLWAQLSSDLFAAIPNPLAGLDAAKIKAVPRAQRTAVQVESLSSIYVTDVTPLITDKEKLRLYGGATGVGVPNAPAPVYGAPGGFGAGGPGGEFGGAPAGDYGPPGGAPPVAAAPGATGTGSRGFVVTMKLVTSNLDAPDLIEKAVVPALKAHMPSKAQPRLQYSIPQVMVTNAIQFKEDPQRLQKIRADFEAATRPQKGAAATIGGGNPGAGPMFGGGGEFGPAEGGMPGGYNPGQFAPGGAPGAPGAPDEKTVFQDRDGLGEDVRNDWEVTVVVVVQLEPPAFVESATPTAAAN